MHSAIRPLSSPCRGKHYPFNLAEHTMWQVVIGADIEENEIGEEAYLSKLADEHFFARV